MGFPLSLSCGESSTGGGELWWPTTGTTGPDIRPGRRRGTARTWPVTRVSPQMQRTVEGWGQLIRTGWSAGSRLGAIQVAVPRGRDQGVEAIVTIGGTVVLDVGQLDLSNQ